VIANGWQKSSYSAEASSCVELRWEKPTCLNIATGPAHATLLRESDDPTTVLATTALRLAGLLAAIKADRLT
jgi:hypothetical protein